MKKYQDVTTNSTIDDIRKYLGHSCYISSTEIRIDKITTTPDIFPDYKFNQSDIRLSGKIRGAHKNKGTPERKFRKKRIFFSSSSASKDEWHIKIDRGNSYRISRSDDGSKFQFKHFMKKYLITSAIMESRIIIHESLIPNAGRGAFAKVDLEEDIVLGDYTGNILTESEAIRSNSDKLMTLRRKPNWWPKYEKFHRMTFIDGTSWTSIINDYRGTLSEPNVAFTESGVFYTLRPILAGEEFYIDYGASYWKGYNARQLLVKN